jgi:hypothetical protein
VEHVGVGGGILSREHVGEQSPVCWRELPPGGSLSVVGSSFGQWKR